MLQTDSSKYETRIKARIKKSVCLQLPTPVFKEWVSRSVFLFYFILFFIFLFFYFLFIYLFFFFFWSRLIGLYKITSPTLKSK